jgi:hypothetical protein
MEIDARIANMLITAVKDDTVKSVALAEEKLVKALTEGSKLVDFGKIATEMGDFFTKVSEWAGGKASVIEVISAGVAAGINMIWPGLVPTIEKFSPNAGKKPLNMTPDAQRTEQKNITYYRQFLIDHKQWEGNGKKGPEPKFIPDPYP